MIVELREYVIIQEGRITRGRAPILLWRASLLGLL